MPEKTVKTLGEFTERVRKIRQDWSDHEELWFRGESKKHETALHPKLYRPREKRALKPVPELLKIENELCDEFQRCGFQLSAKKSNPADFN